MSTKTSAATATTEAASESFLSRTLFAPVLFVSFLFSLLWIDRSTSAEIFTHKDPKPKTRKVSEPQYYHSHQRHLAKREFDDAFAYQNKVIMLLCVGSAVLLVSSFWAAWRFWQWEFGEERFWTSGSSAAEI